MIHLIVASHGPLSASIVKSASLIVGSSSTESLNLDKEDIEALNSLIELGIKVGMMPTPNDKFVDLKPLLRNKLKGE